MLAIIQNDPEVPAGAFADYLAEERVPFRTVCPYEGDVLPAHHDIGAAIVLGGAMGVHDTDRYPFLLDVSRFIREAVEREVPLLGICLGGQLLASTLGGRVTAASLYGERGTLPTFLTKEGAADPLFDGVSAEFVTFQWHNDSFETPPGGVLLASSSACPQQAFRYRRNAWGTQFHPEVNRAIVDLWARWSKETAPHVDQFLADFSQHEENYRKASRRILANFLRIARLV